MGIVQVSNQYPIAFKGSGRHYNEKNWNKQSEDLRGKPWEEVFGLIKRQFEYERLDMQKLKSLLGRLSPDTNWSNVINNLQDFFNEYEQKNKPSAWGEITYTEADELRFERKKLLNELRSRVNAQKEKEFSVGENFNVESDVVFEDPESNPDLEKTENQFDKVQDWEDKEKKHHSYVREGDHSLNRDNPQAKRIAAERGAREKRKNDRLYF